MRIVFTALLSLALFTPGYAQTLDKAKLDQFFDRLAEKNKAMGSLTITKDGQMLYARSIGYSQINGTEKKLLTRSSRYRVGSVTKMFTAVMIFQLVEEGKLKLTDNLDKFFPQVPNANKITIAHILAHRSGIHEVSGDREFRTRRLDGMTKDELLALVVNSKPDFEPDAKDAYSNTGFQLLGMLIEKLTGQSYQEALQERITSKIGLKDTYLAMGNIDVNKNECFSYRYYLDWKQEPQTHASLLFGSGALISTPADLATFIQTLFNLKLVSKESLDQMKQNTLGMQTFTYHGKTFYGHTGGVDNFGSWLVYLPEEKLALAYTSNAKVYPVAKIIDGVFDIYYNKPFTIPDFEAITVNPDVLDKYVGVYSIPGAPMKFTFSRDGATLYVQMTGQSAIPLEPITHDKFGIESAGIVFEFDAAGSQLIQKRNGRERVLTKENQ
ncbi:serine hydrolase domain-containing protein [Spirosoma soli]|uniref:Serine hydrolase domain-containing protein n=1 Tax=Spirosoma soli TaxID=1770529 RepID=A0ABW5M6M7_9BACT